ncbi:MAG: ion transporter [Lachnospiraceae bacterium]|nr:ion transporter [Candidatus Colinaster scatohippi]
MSKKRENIKQEIFDIIEIGNKSDIPSTLFDMFIVVMIWVNLAVTLAFTFSQFDPYKGLLEGIETFTVIVFTIEYILRLWTADRKYRGIPQWKASFKFIISFYGIIDLLTFLPFYLPFVFPSGIVAFRILRVFRIFRLFKINSQYDAFNVITSVLEEKRNQLLSSMCLIMILMTASSLAIYGFENEAQPDVFKNAFSGIWWSVSTLLTVGYGDIYPITTAGRILGIITAFLGVGLVAIPTGIISAGFVEQYTMIKGDRKSAIDGEFDCKDCPWRKAYMDEHKNDGDKA